MTKNNEHSLVLALLLSTVIAAAAPCRADNPADTADTSESFAEGIHAPSLIAQSRGMERRFLYQNLIMDEMDLTAYLEDILIDKLALPEESSVGVGYNLRVRILRSNSFNAFAAPNGTIYVCTGLLSRVTNEAQIAAVLAHELAHIVGWHTEKNLLMMKEQARTIAAASPKRQRRRDAETLILTDGIAGSVTGDALRSAVAGYVSQLELEADSVAVVRMAAAGYPPIEDFRAFINSFAGMEGHGGKSVAHDLGKNQANVPGKGKNQDNPIKNVKTGNDGADDIETGYFNVKLGGIILYDALMNHAAGKPELVEPQLGKLLAVDSCDAAVLIRRGDMERQLSPRSTAPMEWYERALKCSPNNTSALRALGFAYHAIGDTEKARGYLRRYCEAAGDAADVKMAREVLRRCE